jgi:hypothetical protein
VLVVNQLQSNTTAVRQANVIFAGTLLAIIPTSSSSSTSAAPTRITASTLR